MVADIFENFQPPKNFLATSLSKLLAEKNRKIHKKAPVQESWF